MKRNEAARPRTQRNRIQGSGFALTYREGSGTYLRQLVVGNHDVTLTVEKLHSLPTRNAFFSLAADKRIAQPRDRIVSVDLMPALAQVNLGISTGRFEKLQRVHARELGCHALRTRRRASSASTPTRGLEFFLIPNRRKNGSL